MSGPLTVMPGEPSAPTSHLSKLQVLQRRVALASLLTAR
jgi:hypothetical protein